MADIFNPRLKLQAAILDTGMAALGEAYETTVRLASGSVQTESVAMCLTHMDVERAKVLGIDLHNSEAVNVTVSLAALGYRPRPGMEFPIDGKIWKVHGRPVFSNDLCRIALKRRTS